MAKNNQEVSVEKNYIYNLAYQMIAVVVPILITPYVSRVLKADGIGIFSYTTAIAGYFALIGNLGIATYGQLQVAKYRRDKEQVSKIFFELIILRSILLFIIIATYIFFIQIQSRPNYSSMYYVLIVQLVSSLLDISWLLQGMEEFKKIVIRNIIIKVLSVVMIFLFVRRTKDLLLYSLIMNGSTLLGNFSIWVYIPRFVHKVKISSLSPFRHLSSCISFFIPTIATTIYLTLDKTMIGWFTKDAFENGYYEQAQKIEQMIVTVVTSLSVVTMPRMAYLYKNNQIQQLKKQLKQSIQFILLVATPMCLGLIAISNDFIPLFLGNGFNESINILKVFSLLIIIVGLNNAVGKQVLMPVGRQRAYNVSVIGGAVINVLFNLLFIPKMFSLGSAVASVIAEAAILISFIYYSRDFIDFVWIIKAMRNYLLSSIVMLCGIKAIGYFTDPSWLTLGVQIFIGIVIYFVILVFLRDSFFRKYQLLLKEKLINLK
ncbi:TPA: flippase [Streptococcus suis]